MDDNKVKELISEAFLRLILAKNRFSISKSDTDYGVDLMVNPILTKTRPDGRPSSYPSDKRIDIQLKCTTEKQISHVNSDYFKFKLKVKNYEDLIERRTGLIPLMLIVFVLPDDEKEWIEIVHDQLLLKKCGYWYLIQETNSINTTHLGKTSTVPIQIPYENRLTLDFKSLFDQIWALKLI